MKLKIGDEIRAIDDYYGITTKSNRWEGVVIAVNQDYDLFEAKTTKCKDSVIIGEVYDDLMESHFELIKPKIEQEAVEL